MSTFITLPPKLVNASAFIAFDYISQLTSGETISGSSVTCSVFSGTDANPSALISGVTSVAGSIVTQKIVDGLTGVIYLLTCSATTSLGNVKFIQAYLAIIDSNPFEA